VSYDSHVRTDLSLTQMNSTGKHDATMAISKIVPGSTTNLSGGLFQGVAEFAKQGKTGRPSSVLLFTDGLANNGIQDTEGIVEGLTSYLAQTNGVTVFTFGFGEDHNENMLRAISDAGKGIYYFIKTPEHIPQAFADCLGGLVSVSAQNVRLQLRTLDGTRIEKVHSEFPTETKKAGEEITLDLGDLYCEEERDIVVSLQIPAISANPAWHAMVCTLEYFDAVHHAPSAALAHVQLARPEALSEEEAAALDERVMEHEARISAAAALAQANELGRRGDYAGARGVLDGRMASLGAMHQSPMVQQLSSDMASCRAGFEDERVFRTWGGKQTSNYSMGHMQQRSCWAEEERMTYRTSAKARMLSSARAHSEPATAPAAMMPRGGAAPESPPKASPPKEASPASSGMFGSLAAGIRRSFSGGK